MKHVMYNVYVHEEHKHFVTVYVFHNFSSLSAAGGRHIHKDTFE